MSARLIASALVVLLLPGIGSAADIIVVNGDPAGIGFNDPTPAAPVGGNPGTTVGAQALNVFQRAAERWGSRLQSTQPIRIIAFFTPLNCTATSGVLGAAGPYFYFRDIPPVDGGRELARNTWYPAALAEKITRQDVVVDPEEPFEIFALFNSRLGQPGCLTNNGWYYGLDNSEPANRIDLLAVVLHEFGHGLGFSVGPTSSNTGARTQGFPSVWESNMLDTTTNKRWIDMTNAERAASARNNQNLVWAGRFASNVVPSVLDPTVYLDGQSSAGSATVEALRAAFGVMPRGQSTRGPVAYTADSGGPAAFDACEPFPSSAAVRGSIVLADRGNCAFLVKAQNAQRAGAEGLVVANNAAGPLSMTGVDPNITIPVVGVTQAAGAAIRANLPLVITIRPDSRVRAGTVANSPRLYAPTAFAQGSSVSHWDTSVTPNLLMEPFINTDLTSSVKHPEDLSLNLLRDIGW